MSDVSPQVEIVIPARNEERDPAPTLAQFEAMVAKHEIHYYVGRGSNSFGGGTGSSGIASWVAAHFTAQTVGGTTVYDLTQAK